MKIFTSVSLLKNHLSSKSGCVGGWGQESNWGAHKRPSLHSGSLGSYVTLGPLLMINIACTFSKQTLPSMPFQFRWKPPSVIRGSLPYWVEVWDGGATTSSWFITLVNVMSGWWGGSVGEGICHQDWWPEFDHLGAKWWRREITQVAFCLPHAWHVAHVHIHICIHKNK